MKDTFPCPIIPKASGKSLHEQSATIFILLTEVWALFLLNRWSHYLGLSVGDPKNTKPKLYNNGTELLPPTLFTSIALLWALQNVVTCCPAAWDQLELYNLVRLL